jgi:hypothetical protein
MNFFSSTRWTRIAGAAWKSNYERIKIDEYPSSKPTYGTIPISPTPPRILDANENKMRTGRETERQALIAFRASCDRVSVGQQAVDREFRLGRHVHFAIGHRGHREFHGVACAIARALGAVPQFVAEVC